MICNIIDIILWYRDLHVQQVETNNSVKLGDYEDVKFAHFSLVPVTS